jgi:hypothetical protein
MTAGQGMPMRPPMQGGPNPQALAAAQAMALRNQQA